MVEIIPSRVEEYCCINTAIDAVPENRLNNKNKKFYYGQTLRKEGLIEIQRISSSDDVSSHAPISLLRDGYSSLFISLNWSCVMS
jgi:hypothetical protein